MKIKFPIDQRSNFPLFFCRHHHIFTNSSNLFQQRCHARRCQAESLLKLLPQLLGIEAHQQFTWEFWRWDDSVAGYLTRKKQNNSIHNIPVLTVGYFRYRSLVARANKTKLLNQSLPSSLTALLPFFLLRGAKRSKPFRVFKIPWFWGLKMHKNIYPLVI